MKIAVMGCGNIARVTWGPDLAAVRKSLKADGKSLELYFYDPDRAAAEALASKHGATVCASVEEALGHQPAGVVVATPPHVHAQLALAAIAAGAHVAIEKPFATIGQQAFEVVQAAREAGLRISMPYHQLLMAADPLQRIADGAIGDVTFVEYVWRRRRLHTVRPLFDVGSHALAMGAALAGWPQDTRAFVQSAGGIDVLSAELGSVGLSARLEFGAPIDRAEQISVRVTGSVGELCFGLHTTQTRRRRLRATYVYAGTEEQLSTIPVVDVVRTQQVARWVASLSGGEPLPVDGERGLYVQRLEDAARKAERVGAWVIPSLLRS